MSDLPPPEGAPVDDHDYSLDPEVMAEFPEVVNFAPDPPSTIGEGYPVGFFAGHGVATTWIGEHEWAVDPDTGCITGQA